MEIGQQETTVPHRIRVSVARKHKSQPRSSIARRGNSSWLVLQPAIRSNRRLPYGLSIEIDAPPVFEENRDRRHRRTMKSGSINNTGRRPSSSAEREIGASAIMHWSESPRPPAVPGKGLTLIAKLIVTNVRSPTGGRSHRSVHTAIRSTVFVEAAVGAGRT